jgi:hypothetical protein
MAKNTRIVLVLIFLLFVAGCGTRTVTVKGRLVYNGEPYVPGENESVRMSFISADESKPVKEGGEAAFVVSVNQKDGTFEVTGSKGKGLPPGKYRACVEVLKSKKDIFQGAFNAQNSPFLCTVETGLEDLTFDLAVQKEAPTAPQQTAPRQRNPRSRR